MAQHITDTAAYHSVAQHVYRVVAHEQDLAAEEDEERTRQRGLLQPVQEFPLLLFLDS